MPQDPEIERVLDELNEWCKAEYGRQAEVARILGVTRQQVYDWTSKRKMPSLTMWVRIQAFLKSQRARKPGTKA